MTGPWIDVSVPVRDGMVHWPTDRPVQITRESEIARGDEANLTHLSMSAHTGTHLDAPVHFIAEADGIDALPLEVAHGPARVVEITDPEAVREEELRAKQLAPGERLVLKTRNSSRRWWEEPFDDAFIHIDPQAAAYLATIAPPLVAVDYLSVGGMETGAQTHRHLLGAGIWIAEGLDLTGVEPGEYELICLPIRIAGADGAPARVLLRSLENEDLTTTRRRDGRGKA